jgi:ATP-dependent RNA helicase DeaD
MESYRIEVGHRHGVKPGNIGGAIANEADLESRYIGRIDIHDDHSVVDLPQGMSKEVEHHLRRVFVRGKALRLRALGAEAAERGAGARPYRERPPGREAGNRPPRDPRPKRRKD